MSLLTKFQAPYNTQSNLKPTDNFSNDYGKSTVTNETQMASSIN